MRKPIIAGNWKMHKTIAEALEFVNDVKDKVNNDNVEAVICAPFTLLKDLKEATKGTNIKIGAQNMHFEEKGAFTGEISPLMLKELDMDYVVIGHSERRQYFNETNETVNKKVLKALEVGIDPILCVGETLEEREAGNTKDVCKVQVEKALENEVRIQYGGSVKPSNVAEIMNQSDIDGALVGGASLEANDYVKLVNF